MTACNSRRRLLCRCRPMIDFLMRIRCGTTSSGGRTNCEPAPSLPYPGPMLRGKRGRKLVANALFHPEAQEEYELALAWYRKQSLRVAQGFDAEVERVLGLIDGRR